MDIWTLVSMLTGSLIALVLMAAILFVLVLIIAGLRLTVVNTRPDIHSTPEHPSRHLRALD